jgi:hypothetical protein
VRRNSTQTGLPNSSRRQTGIVWRRLREFRAIGNIKPVLLSDGRLTRGLSQRLERFARTRGDEDAMGFEAYGHALSTGTFASASRVRLRSPLLFPPICSIGAVLFLSDPALFAAIAFHAGRSIVSGELAGQSYYLSMNQPCVLRAPAGGAVSEERRLTALTATGGSAAARSLRGSALLRGSPFSHMCRVKVESSPMD